MLSRAVFRRLTNALLLEGSFVFPCVAVVRARSCPNLNASRVSPPFRSASSASSTRWKARQGNEHYARQAKVQGLKGRAAFKLLQINDRYKIFRKGATVVDLGYAPGSWTQVAVNRTSPGGRVIGVDIIPAQPPRGASTIQGDFLSPAIQAEVRSYVSDLNLGRPRKKRVFRSHEEDETDEDGEEEGIPDDPDYIDVERASQPDTIRSNSSDDGDDSGSNLPASPEVEAGDGGRLRPVDVVLSDMSEPWALTTGSWKKSLSDPYRRMMNTSGMAFRDHAGSMDLCNAALEFCFDTLRTGGHFVCKFYQGAEDKLLEKRMKRLFEKVHREKPPASRSESRESYFVCLRRKEDFMKEEVFAE